MVLEWLPNKYSLISGPAPRANIFSSQPMAQQHNGGIVALMMNFDNVTLLPTADSTWQILTQGRRRSRMRTTMFFVPDWAVNCY